MNKPQLSAEMEKRFDEKFVCNEHPMEEWHYQDLDPDEVKNFLATALEEQRVSILKLINEVPVRIVSGDQLLQDRTIKRTLLACKKAILNGKGAE